MPTCTRGTTTKKINGTLKLKIGGVEMQSINLSDEGASEQWNNCRCERGTYQENVCVTATQQIRNEEVKGSREVTTGVTIEWDLKVDTDRRITNCDFDCIVQPPNPPKPPKLPNPEKPN